MNQYIFKFVNQEYLQNINNYGQKQLAVIDLIVGYMRSQFLHHKDCFFTKKQIQAVFATNGIHVAISTIKKVFAKLKLLGIKLVKVDKKSKREMKYKWLTNTYLEPKAFWKKVKEILGEMMRMLPNYLNVKFGSRKVTSDCYTQPISSQEMVQIETQNEVLEVTDTKLIDELDYQAVDKEMSNRSHWNYLKECGAIDKDAIYPNLEVFSADEKETKVYGEPKPHVNDAATKNLPRDCDENCDCGFDKNDIDRIIFWLDSGFITSEEQLHNTMNMKQLEVATKCRTRSEMFKLIYNCEAPKTRAEIEKEKKLDEINRHRMFIDNCKDCDYPKEDLKLFLWYIDGMHENQKAIKNEWDIHHTYNKETLKYGIKFAKELWEKKEKLNANEKDIFEKEKAYVQSIRDSIKSGRDKTIKDEEIADDEVPTIELEL